MRAKTIQNNFLRSQLALAALRLALFAGLFQVAFAPAAQLAPGDLVIANAGSGILYRYQPDSATVSVLASLSGEATDIALGEGPDAGRAWVAIHDNTIQRVDLGSGLATTLADGHSFIGVALHNGLIYSTALDQAVRVYDAHTGSLVHTYTFPAASKLLGIRYDSLNDRMVISDLANGVDAMTLDGTFSNLVSAAGANFYHLALESNGNVVLGSMNAVVQRMDVHAGNSLSTVAAGAPLYNPVGVAIDASGNIYAADFFNGNLIRMKSDGTDIVNLGTIGTNANDSYSVVVTTAAASFSLFPPLINSQPQNQTNGFGTTAAFTVNASGTPPLSYQWLFHGTNLTDTTRITGSRSNHLTIGGTIGNDLGGYQVIVTNAYGAVTSVVAVLTTANATIVQQPQSQLVSPGINVSFYVVASGTPPPNYQWRFNGTNLTDGGRVTGSRTDTLSIAALQATDLGLYDVILSNVWGSITSDAASLKFANQTPPPPNAAPSVLWARTGGGPIPGWLNNVINGALDSMSVAVADGKGGVYAAGAFSEYARFGSVEVTAPTGVQNLVLVKYDAEGKPVWAKQGVYEAGGGGSAAYTVLSGLAATPDGGVVVAGYCLVPSTIDGQFIGKDSNTNLSLVCPDCLPYGQPGWAGFVAKYDANGTRLWFHLLYAYDIDPRVATDPLGNIYVISKLVGAVELDGQMSPAYGRPFQAGWGEHQYLLKFNPAGGFQSMTEILAPQEFYETVDVYDLKADAEGNCYLLGKFGAAANQGYFTYTLNIGSVPLTTSDPNDGGADISFAAKLDSSGAGLWAKPISTSSLVSGDTHHGGSIQIDSHGNMYLSVPAQQCTDLSSPDRCHPDSKLVKLNPFGTELWEIPGVTFGALSTGQTHALVCDAAGNCVAAGWYQPRDFQELTGQAVSSPYGPTYGMGLVAFDPAGGIRWAKYFAEQGSISAPVLVQDSPNSWFLAGTFIVDAQLDPFQLQTPWGGDDIENFIARLVIPSTNDLPIITLQPSNVAVFETRPLGLQVAAASLSDLSYQWRSNGIPLPAATSNTLAFAYATPPLSGQYSVSVSNSNGHVDSAPAIVTVLPLTTLAQALNATNLEWRLGGVRSWNLETNVTHDGVLSLRTDYLNPGANPIEDCWIETTLPGPGVLSFWWKASVNVHNPFCNCDDGFQFLLDGVQQFEILGEVDWQPRSIPVGPGSHTVRWQWSEPNIPGNLNLCWVDQVSFQTDAAPTISDATRLVDGKIQFTIHTSPGATLGIEASSDLKTWLAVGQLVSTNGVATFTNAPSVSYQQHFYRAVIIPP